MERKYLPISIPAELYEKIKRTARENDRTISGHIVHMIKKHFDKTEKEIIKTSDVPVFRMPTDAEIASKGLNDSQHWTYIIDGAPISDEWQEKIDTEVQRQEKLKTKINVTIGGKQIDI